ncbi:MAG: DUF3857 domain-containing protein [Kiritimatiellia bacterium]|jgi:transglutaminase-like putative cysteine protease
MKRRTLLFTFVLLLAGFAPCHAARPPRAELLAHAADVNVAAHPDADTVLVWDHTFESYQPDGTGVSTNEWYEKILTEKGRRKSRTASFWLNASYGSVAVCLAEIVKPDGTAVAIDVERNSRLMIEPGQMSSNIFDPNSQVLTLTLPGLEVDDVLHFVVARETTKARVPDAFGDYAVFEHTMPILEIVHEIDAPPERPLQTIRVRDEIGAGVAYEALPRPDGGTLHRWRAADVPQVFPEPDMPPLHTCAQRLLVSTIPTWRDLSRWYWNLSEPRMAATVPDMQTTVDDLVADAATRDERIWRVFTYVSQKIRYMGVTPEEEAPGYEPHDVKLTFQNKYGVCRDKAALLVAMLRMAGVEAYPVLIHVGERRDPDVPQIFFNHAIVAAASDKPDATGADRYILMDPTNENTARLLPEYLCEKSFLVATPEGETLLESPALPADENLARIETTGAIRDGALHATTTVRLAGINDTMYRGGLARLGPRDRRLFIEGRLQAQVPGARLESLRIEPDDLQDTAAPLAFAFSYVQDNPWTAGDAGVLAAFPQFAEAFGYVNHTVGRTGLEERRFPLQTEIPCALEESVAIDIGLDAAAFAAPADVAVETDGVAFTRHMAVANGTLAATSRLAMLKSIYPPDAYRQLRGALQRIETARLAAPIFTAAPAAREAGLPDDLLAPEKPDDILVLAEETTLEPGETPDTWSETVRTRKRILTYAGKIRAGDVKFSYNPAMNHVELLAATVTSPDGATHAVTDLETNVMDQPWVASAPRYPAGKTLVVSFPGLEVGSEIDFTIRRTWHGAPFRAYVKRFGGFDDIAEQSLHVVGGASFAQTRAEAGSAPLHVAHTNLPGLVRERNLPPSRYLFERQTRLAPETTAWDYGAQIVARMDACATQAPLAAAKALELTAGKTTVADKTRAIRDFIATQIRVAGPAYSDLPLARLSPADATFESGYGHAADVAILTRAMLAAAGVPSRFVLVDSTRAASDADAAVEGYDLFDAILVAVDDGGATCYVNDGSQYSELQATSCEGMMAADLDARQWVALRADPGYEARVSNAFEMDVEPNGDATLSITTEYRGTAVEGFRRLYRELQPEDRRRHVLEVVSAFSRKATLDGPFETDLDAYPAVRRFRIRIPAWGVVQDGFMSVRLPGADAATIAPRYANRRLPFWRDVTHRFDDVLVLRFADGIDSVATLPEAVRHETPDGSTRFATTAETAQTPDGRLQATIKRNGELTRALFGPDVYEPFAAAALKTQGRRADTMVVKAKPGE